MAQKTANSPRRCVFWAFLYSRFAKVMVEADYLMKRITDGSFILNVEGFESLTDMELKKTKKVWLLTRMNHILR